MEVESDEGAPGDAGVGGTSPLSAEDAALRLQARVRGFAARRGVLRAGGRVAVLPAKVLGALKLHQLLGVRFLFEAMQAGGGLLCDDPGLGKTFSAIALVSALLTSLHVHRVLIAVPANVVGVWVAEFARWTGTTVPLVVVGASEAGLHARLKLRDLGAVKKPEQQVVVASMSMLLNHGSVRATDLSPAVASPQPLHHPPHPFLSSSRAFVCPCVRAPQGLVASEGVDLLVVDEAHRLRNRGETANAIEAVPANARVLLTGTPLSNNLAEFYTILDLANPGSLGTRAAFEANFVRPMAAARKADATKVRDALPAHLPTCPSTHPLIISSARQPASPGQPVSPSHRPPLPSAGGHRAR